MKMSKKMKECFTPHSVMHSLIGLGLGITLVSLIPSLGMLWIGVLIIIVAMVWDMSRK